MVSRRKPLLAGWLALYLGTGLFAGARPQAAKQVPARDAKSGMPSVDAVIARYVEAVGGREAWETLKSRVSMGTVEVPSANLSGTVVIHEKAPDKILTILIISGSGFRQGFDGTVGWTQDAQNGVREQSGAELAEAKRQADFYSPLNVHEHYAKLTLLATEKVGEHDTYVLEGTLPEGGGSERIYFDRATGLPVRLIGQHHSPDGVAQFQEDFSDFRRVDGVMLPFAISQSDKASTFLVRIGEVRHNVELEDSEFSKPAVE